MVPPPESLGGSSTKSRRSLPKKDDGQLDVQTFDYPSNDAERQEAGDPFFPRSTKNEFLDTEAAVEFYRKECKTNGLLVNNSFVRYLRSGSVIMEFDNGYLGENGVIPIMRTLRHVRLMKLLLPKCALEDEEIHLICETLCEHPTIESIDFRGNRITVSGAKSILRLLMKNKHITEVFIDSETPKSAAIFRQAADNGTTELRTFACLVCHHPVVYTLARQVEMSLLKNILSNCSTNIDRVSSVQVEVLFRLLLVSCEAHNGILSLCSESCVERMSRFIYESLVVVLKACYVKVPYELPNNQLIRQSLPTIISDFKSRSLSKKDYCGQGSDDDDSDDVEQYFDNAIDQGVNEQCSVCGQKGKYQRNGVVLLMRQLIKEIDKCEEMSSSGLLRLCHLMISQVDVKPCSAKCTRQLIRFGMYGFYGVIRAYPKQEPLLTSTGANLEELPEESFSVTDFSDTVVSRLDEEEITCALTVASAMEDIDGVPIDPYMIFAIGRHLRQQPTSTIGMELQTACEAVHLVGCLAQSDAPFNRRAGDRPPRRLYANWEDWHRLGDVQKYLYIAFSRRRAAVFCVDGPHGNVFDNIRSALWAFRRQRRCVVVAMKFSYQWLVAESGVVPETSSAAGGFYTSLKIIGQTAVNNSLYLIAQGNFGRLAGHQGFFYIPKSVFNRHISHNAYIFVDIPKTTAVDDVRKLYAAQLITPFSLSVVAAAQEHRDLFSVVESAVRLHPSSKDEKEILQEILTRAPAAISFITNKAHPPTKNQSRWIKYFQMLVVHSPMSAQLAHYLNEICPPEIARYFNSIFTSNKETISFLRSAYKNHAMKQSGCPSGKECDDLKELQWVPVDPEYMDGAGAQLGTLIKKRPKKKADKNGRGRPSPSGVKGVEVKTEERMLEGSEAVLGEIWSVEQTRMNELSQKPETHHYAVENMFPFACCTELNRQLFHQRSIKVEDMSMNDSVSHELLAHRWNLFHVCDDKGRPSRVVVAVIHHSACVYDLESKEILCRFAKIPAVPLLSGFPFFSGFDTCFHHPQKPQHVFVFSNSIWFQWNAVKQKCCLGPFEIKAHPQFAKLPSRFHQRVDVTIAVPGTPYVVFIVQKLFVVFNMETRCPAGPSQLLNRDAGEISSPVTLPADLTEPSAYEAMTHYWKNTDQGSSIVVVCANGELLQTSFPSDGSVKRRSLPRSALRALPMAFRQMTAEAIPALCEAITSKYFQAPFNSRIHQVELFNKKKESFVDIFSTHMIKTPVAEQNPKSLYSQQRCSDDSQLLCDEVHFYGKPLDDKNEFYALSTVEYDLGEDPLSFCGVILILEAAKVHPEALQLAPLTVMVESSIDQVTYRSHATFRAMNSVAFGSWADVHVARFWRVKFLDAIPEDVGIAKVFWYKGKWSSLVGRLPVLESFIPPPGTASISVAAEMLLRPAQMLWSGAGGSAVFVTSGKKGWFDKHAVLPLLPSGSTCLFFCGSSFLEFNMATYEVVAGRTMDLRTHPAFSRLPSPFNTGFDAIFYPDISDSNVVIIVRNGYEIRWSLTTGETLGQAGVCTSMSFTEVNIDMTRIYDIMNVWDRPHEVDIVFMLEDGNASVLRWNIKEQQIVSTPRALQHFPHLHHPEFDGKPLLCLFSTPRRPKSVFVFCETTVANSELIPTPQEVRYTKEFFRLTWRMSSWCEASKGCLINVDFMGNLVFLLGMELVSSAACGMRWNVECSDDNMNWINVGVHVQDKPRSRTTWTPSHVHNRAHRFWRFAVSDSEDEKLDLDATAYKLISFLILPLFKFYEPSRSQLLLSSNSKSEIRDLFRRDTSITFHSKELIPSLHRSAGSSPTLVHHITLDYQEYPAHLCSVSCLCEDTCSDSWSVLCSDDGVTWTSVGSWRRNHPQIRLSWFVGRSYRFWRLEIQSERQTVRFRNFALYGYKGPFLALDSHSPMTHRCYASLVPLLYESNILREDDDDVPIEFDIRVGSVLTVDTKATTAAVVGIALRCSFSTAEKVDFVVEHSDDHVWWYEAVQFSLFGSALESSAYWNTVGSHRYWRLRVVSTSSDGYMVIKNVFLSVSQTNLYRMYLTQADRHYGNDVLSEQPQPHYFHSPTPVSIVRIEVRLPPGSVYVVEKLGLDSFSWDPIALLENPDAAEYAVVEKGWDSPLPSCSWRLRIVETVDNEQSTGMLAVVKAPIKWYAFTNRRLFRVPCEEVDGLEVTLTRFTTLESVEAIHLNRSGFPVLEIVEPELPPQEETPVKNADDGLEEAAKKRKEDNGKRGRGKLDEASKRTRSKSDEAKKKKGSRENGKKVNSKAEEAAKKAEEAAAKVEVVPKKKALPKPEDPSILFTFRYPTRLSQVHINATLPKVEEVSGITSVPGSKKSSSASAEASSEAGSESAADRMGSKAENEVEENDNEIEFGPNPPLKIVVEVSDSGVDFVSLAEGPLFSGSTSLAWCGEEVSKYWRVRFVNTFDEKELRVFSVKWFTYLGVASNVRPEEHFMLTNAVYGAQLMEDYNYEEEFCSSCRLGFNQAKSQASKLREETDIDKIGETAKSVWQYKKAYQAFISKVAKAAARNAEPPEGPYFGGPQTLAKDINYFLHMTSMKFPDSGFGTLIEMVGVPLLLKEVQFNKKDSHWFYPSFEISGPLMEDVYDFSNAPASFSVLWSLSGPVQRDLKLLQDPTLSCVSVHVASPMISLSIESDDWLPVKHFPFVPFLYHGGYARKPTIVVFALNEILFTDKFYMRTPVTGKAVSNQPFRVTSGVNFIRTDTLSRCPAPVFGVLKWIYPESFLESYKTPLVLTVSSLRCLSGKMRFTLPGKGIFFGIEGLEIASLEFEITMTMLNQAFPAILEEGLPEKVDMDALMKQFYCECDYQVSFVSHGATFRVKGDRGIETIPIALAGSFDQHGSPVIKLSGISMSANIPLDGVRDTRLSAVRIAGIVSASEKPESFLVPHLTVSGNIVLSGGCIFPCHYGLPRNSYVNVVDRLYLDLWEASLEDCISLSMWAKSATTDRAMIFPKDKSVYTAPCSLCVSLEVDLSCFKLHGNGSIKLFGETTDDAEVLVDSNGFGILCSIPHAMVGNIEMESPAGSAGVVAEVSCMFLEGSKPDVSVHLAGASGFFSPGASTKLHLSRKGCVCLCSTPYFDLSVEENSADPTCNNAHITMHNSTLLEKIVKHLKCAPMIVALLAQGLPFCLSNEKLSAGPYSAIQQSLTLRFSGVFFGSFFEVTSPSFNPVDMVMSYDALCNMLALRTVEECQDTIWASYGSVVGCLQVEEVSQKQLAETTFVSRWHTQEHAGMKT